MKRLTEEQIKKINQKHCDQGIFKEPNHIPNHIKDHVVYMRWESGGYSGGNCWDDSDPQPYTRSQPKFEVLYDTLKAISPNVTVLQLRDIEEAIEQTDAGSYNEYYGNSTEYEACYVPLETIYKILGI
jgi:hypothetical protein